MRRALKWIIWGVLALIVVVALIALWKREELARLMAVNSLFHEDKIVNNFSNMNVAFLSAVMDKGPSDPSPLPGGAPLTLSEAAEDWIKDHAITALVVLKDGELRFEQYYQGTEATDRRVSWSVAKSFLSALIGTALEKGEIENIDVPVTKYAPNLIGTAYDGVSLRNVLQMSSGVTFDEDYLDYDSDINKMGRTLALGGSMDEFAAGLNDRFVEPGTKFQYVSIDTHVLGMVLRGATGQSVIDLLQERIIAPLGLEEDPYYLTDGFGVAFVLGGLNLRTRDYARFGQMIAQGGQWQGKQVVPQQWITDSIAPSANTASDEMGYGYQWWIPQEFEAGEVLARGVYDQFIYINQSENIVIAINGANKKFREEGAKQRNVEMIKHIADLVLQ